VDAKDNVWIIHRPGSLEAGEHHATGNPPIAQCCEAAPPCWSSIRREFDRALGRTGSELRLACVESRITVDYKGNVWIGGNGREADSGRGAVAGADETGNKGVATFEDNMILKFTPSGKFLLQIGKPHSSKGSNDVANLRLPAKTFVDPKTNELYVADGYGNHA